MSAKLPLQELSNAPATAPGKRSRCLIEFDVDEFKTINHVSDDAYVLGIDEAGRGSVVGPMLYCGAVVALRDYNALVDAGVADSKSLSAESRNAIAISLTGRGKRPDKQQWERRQVPSFQPFVREISASTISTAMQGRLGRNLNTLSHDAAVSIIHEAVNYCKGSLFAVYVDTVGPPVPYERMLKGRFPHLKITVACKADAKFPIVSAASIVAKTRRDESVLSENLLLHCQEHNTKLSKTVVDTNTYTVDVGNGYPSDIRALTYIMQHVHRFFGYAVDDGGAGIVRFSWRPVIDVIEEACVGVTFEADLIDQKEKHDIRRQKAQQSHQISPNLFFEKPYPRRDGLFHSFGLKTCSKMRLF